jgi:alpha-L-fucosidase
MNAMARQLQPHVIINNRSQLPEDFGTPEEHIRAEDAGRAWEACMTFNGSWGYMPYAPAEDWHSSRRVIEMLRQVTSGGGNLLLNIGPAPDGSVPPEATERLLPVGKWLARYGEAVYGKVDRTDGCFEWGPLGQWTRKGKVGYLWCSRWPGKEIVLGGFKTKLKEARILPDGQPLAIVQTRDQLKLQGLPARSPDRLAGTTVIRMEFASVPVQKLGAGYVLL